MSRLEELIQQLCPDGVEYQKIGDVCSTITDYTAAGSFADIAKNVKYITDAVGYAQLIRTTDLKSSFSKPDSYVYVDEHAFKYLWRVNLNCEGLVLPNVGNCGEVYYISPDTFPNQHNVLGPNAIWVKSDFALNRYLYHLFLSKEFQQKLAKIISPTGQTKFNKTNFRKILVPVPPLEIQQEIVRILDQFTELTVELTTQLTAELTARKKQYEYYRDELLTFENGVSYKTLSEVCTISAGGDVPKEATSKNKTEKYLIPIISNGIGENAFYGYTNAAKINTPAVTVAARGTIGYAAYRDYPFYPIIRLLSVIPKETSILGTKYLYYCLKDKQYKIPKSGIPQLTAPELKKVEIPIPALEEQRRIVSILDRLDILFNDLTSDIFAEIEARRKQYEYHRDKLLTFKEVKLNENSKQK